MSAGWRHNRSLFNISIAVQLEESAPFRQSLVDVGGVWNIVDRQRPLQTFNIQWENVIITSLYSVLMFLSVTGNTIALYVLTLGRYIQSLWVNLWNFPLQQEVHFSSLLLLGRPGHLTIWFIFSESEPQNKNSCP